MTTEELKLKYPDAVNMINGLMDNKVNAYYHRGNRTSHQSPAGEFYYNYEGIHYRLFPNLEQMVKWFFGTPKENEEAEATIKNYWYNSYLSKLVDSEVLTDDDGNVAFCDYENSNFTEEQLTKAREEN